MDIADLVTQSDAARLRDVSPSRISHLIKGNRLKVYSIAGRRLLSRTEVLALENLSAGRPPKPKDEGESATSAAEVVTATTDAAKTVATEANPKRTRKAKAAKKTRAEKKGKGGSR